MDLLLRFRSKEVEFAHSQSTKLYLERLFRLACALLPMQLTAQLYLQILNYGTHNGLVRFGINFAAQLMLTLLIAYAYRKSDKLIKYKGIISLAVDLGFLFYITFTFLDRVNTTEYFETKTENQFFDGLWWGSFICLFALIPTRWTTKFLMILVQFTLVTIKFRKSGSFNSNLTGAVIILYIAIFFIYTDELITRKNFLEKHQAHQQASCLHAIVSDLFESIIIYSKKKQRILYTNKSATHLPFWRESESLEDILEGLKIQRLIDTLNEFSEVTDKKTTFIDHSMAEFFQTLKPHCKTWSRTGTHFLIDVVYYDKALEAERKFVIQLLPSTFESEVVWAFIIRDTTEHDMLIALQDNSNYKTRLLASVSHELRTPLNCSITFIQKALEHEEVPTDVKQSYLLPSLNSSKMLLHVINDILDFSQIQANKLRLVYEKRDILHTLTECINLVSIQAEKKNIYIKTQGLEQIGDSFFVTDHNRVRQIVMNLLSNALKFTYKGGITLCIDEKPPVSPTENQQRILQITVEDTGIGIKETDKEKLFKAFEKIELGDRVSLNSTGVGLGLVISNNIASRLGPLGRIIPIEIESAVAKGSKFSFQIVDHDEMMLVEDASPTNIRREGLRNLSLSNVGQLAEEGERSFSIHHYRFWDDQEAKNLLHHKQVVSPLSAGIRRSLFIPNTSESPILKKDGCSCPPILVVDDDMFNIAAMQSILGGMGLKAETAYNGEIAIKKYMEREETMCGLECKPFSLIFMDCNMPVMDGIETTKELKSRMEKGEIRPCPIVACTAFVQGAEVERCKDSGMDGWVTKPLVGEVLRAKLQLYGLI